ncbi:hypothetical protein [Streptomyces sp. NPDC049555]|uniref:hypothetical protein n=1 Tax=unclassified Streptomyces TaxID=2593676 RepID=UPI00343B335D
MKYDALQGLGAILATLFLQGLIRLLVHHDDRGLLAWLPGGLWPALVGHAVLVAVGVVLTGWAHGRAKALGRRG